MEESNYIRLFDGAYAKESGSEKVLSSTAACTCKSKNGNGSQHDAMAGPVAEG